MSDTGAEIRRRFESAMTDELRGAPPRDEQIRDTADFTRGAMDSVSLLLGDIERDLPAVDGDARKRLGSLVRDLSNIAANVRLHQAARPRQLDRD